MNEVANEAAPEPAMRILMVGACPSLSGLSEIAYMVGCPVGAQDVSSTCFRIAGNSSSGKYNANWVPIAAIERALADIPPEQTFSAAALNPIYTSRSANSPGFLAAILLHVGLIARAPEGQSYVRHTADAFWEEVKKLIGSGVSLTPVSMEQVGTYSSATAVKVNASSPKKSKPAATAPAEA